MQRLLPLLLLILGLVATACGNEDVDPAASESPAAGESEDADDDAASDGEGETRAVSSIPAEELERYQAELNEVGCYAGAVDGTLGPQTEAAVRAFQDAAGLTVDGRLGPITEGAIDDAIAAGETVCFGDEGDGADDGDGAMDGVEEGDDGDGAMDGVEEGDDGEGAMDQGGDGENDNPDALPPSPDAGE